jgi:hypothetical protein
MKRRLNECGCGCGGAIGGCQDKETQNYMFFQNLKTIYHAVDELLNMDPAQVDAMLSNGHAWAVDHITTSADDVEEVYHFLTSNMNHEDEYNSQEPQFVPVGFQNHLKQVMGERIEQRDGKWVVKPKKGDHVLGTHPTKKAALKQLAAIEISKHRK